MTTPAPAPSSSPKKPIWTQRWYATCSGCGVEAECSYSYTEPKGWTRARYSQGGIACPACTPRLLAAETAVNEHNEKAAFTTCEAYGPAYRFQQQWDKDHPRPPLPHRFKNVLFSRETFVRRLTCAGCGRVEVREAHVGTMPSRPGDWRYAGAKRGHGPLICPDCKKTLEPYYEELRNWSKKRDEDVGEAFREARKGILKSMAPTYPEGWRTA